MQKVIITIGLPGSGKSSWAKKYCQENPTFVRVCRDDLRHMRGRYWFPKQEELITSFEINCIKKVLEYGYNVVVDATNLKEEFRNNIKSISDIYNAEIEIKDFTNITPEECIERDLKRVDSVGAKVIWHFYDKYLRQKSNVIHNKTLPHAIICDLDGTLCLHNGRDPYDEEKCDTDLINEPVLEILRCASAKAEILFVSGRHDTVREKTLEWIDKTDKGFSGIGRYSLLMRKADDNRNDAIVKKEIFMEHINGKYFIDFVLDDRDRVVAMWRKDLGLTCLQVNYGDF